MADLWPVFPVRDDSNTQLWEEKKILFIIINDLLSCLVSKRHTNCFTWLYYKTLPELRKMMKFNKICSLFLNMSQITFSRQNPHS